jgi:hypothetical protein
LGEFRAGFIETSTSEQGLFDRCLGHGFVNVVLSRLGLGQTGVLLLRLTKIKASSPSAD